MSFKQPLCNVLVVDDEPQVRVLINEELSERGFVCQTADSVEGAIAILGSQPINILVTDIRMPKTSGLALLTYARKHIPQCKVILITGNPRQEYVTQALLLGAYDYIEKPFKTGELVEIISRAANCEAESSMLAERAAAAMELSSHVRQAALDSVRALVLAVEAKDSYTRRHSEQVVNYTTNIAISMGFKGQSLESVKIAALLHDIGKIGVPDHILTKPGSLTEEEFQYIRRHPALGSDILASITMFSNEAKLVRYHHERWDGKGYPDGLTGEECPLGARIIMVADCIDAMLMDRTYKQGYSVQMMIDELVSNAGSQFDPRVVEAAVQWCRENPDKLVLPRKAGTPKAQVNGR